MNVAKPSVWRLCVRAAFTFAGLALASIALSQPALAAESVSKAYGVDIRVEGEGWGTAARDEIETLLYAVADQLVSGPSPSLRRPIVVTHAGGSPVTLFGQGRGGEYRVSLSARNRGWAQYAYQFGHELCHIMSNYDVRGSEADRRENQWFEEAVCEAAGLFVLRSMADRWQRDAPGAEWEDYVPSLRDYAQRLLSEPHRQLASETTPQLWLHTRLPELARDPYRRDDNEVVANLLLPLFEQAPEQWAALHFLNLSPAGAGSALPEYLRQWRTSAPAEHRAFIDHIARILGIGTQPIVAPSAQATSASSAN